MFNNCDSLISITIPANVTFIGYSAFRDSNNLSIINCKPTIPPTIDIGDDFDNFAPDAKIYVPTESVDAYKSAAGWSEYADMIVGYDFE